MRFFKSSPLPDYIPVPGAGGVQVRLKPNARSKRLSLRVSRSTGGVTLSLPPSCPLTAAQDFVAEKAGWIIKHLENRPIVPDIGFGATVPFRGDMFEIVGADVKRVKPSGGQLLVPRSTDMLGAHLLAFYKLQARHALNAATRKYAHELGADYGRISIRDTRSRWGSCSSQGNLNYSWRLIMAPPYVLEYVAAHEVAHLRQMDHSPAFWAIVDRLFPDYKAAKQWLRKNGEMLHSYQF